MPLYEFECSCGFKDEYVASWMQRDVRRLCPKCGRAMQRVVSVPNLAKPPHRTQAILEGGRKVKGDWSKVK